VNQSPTGLAYQISGLPLKGNTAIERVIELQNFNRIPQSISEKEYLFLRHNDGYFAMQRSVELLENRTAVQLAKDFNGGEMYVGNGMVGGGVYFDVDIANNFPTAERFNKKSTTFEVLLSKNAEIITLTKLNSMINHYKIPKGLPKKVEDMLKLSRIQKTLFAALHGYDAILIEQRQYIVLLNRQKSIITI
jgi:hypothetical protein